METKQIIHLNFQSIALFRQQIAEHIDKILLCVLSKIFCERLVYKHGVWSLILHFSGSEITGHVPFYDC